MIDLVTLLTFFMIKKKIFFFNFCFDNPLISALFNKYTLEIENKIRSDDLVFK